MGFTFSGLWRSEKSNDARVLAHSNLFWFDDECQLCKRPDPPFYPSSFESGRHSGLGDCLFVLGAPLEICTDLFWCTGWVEDPSSASLPGFQSSLWRFMGVTDISTLLRSALLSEAYHQYFYPVDNHETCWKTVDALGPGKIRFNRVGLRATKLLPDRRYLPPPRSSKVLPKIFPVPWAV